MKSFTKIAWRIWFILVGSFALFFAGLFVWFVVTLVQMMQRIGGVQ